MSSHSVMVARGLGFDSQRGQLFFINTIYTSALCCLLSKIIPSKVAVSWIPSAPNSITSASRFGWSTEGATNLEVNLSFLKI